jgi:hypothetical protein
VLHGGLLLSPFVLFGMGAIQCVFHVGAVWSVLAGMSSVVDGRGPRAV